MKPLVIAALLCNALPAFAYTLPPTAPAVSVDGTYAITYADYACWYRSASGCLSQWLEERVGPDGTWGLVPGATSTSASFAGKPEGEYSYRVRRVIQESQNFFSESSTEITVSVKGAPPVDPVATQLDYQYETRQGDIDGDGQTDIFIARTSGGVIGNGVLEKVILLQSTSGGAFSLLVPDAAQSDIVAGWPLATTSVVVTDFNVDGFVDVEVKGVAAAMGIPGAFDQIVYSPGAGWTTQPLGLRAVDESLQQFVGNSLDYFVNPNYFPERAPQRLYSRTITYFDCNRGMFSIDYNPWFMTCYPNQYLIHGIYSSYAAFNQDALSLWSNDNAVQSGSASASQALDRIAAAAASALGVPIGGWSMEQEIGAEGPHTDPDYRRNLEVFWAILGIATANADEIDTDEAPAQVPRLPGTIYLTRRWVVEYFATHAALEYTSPVSVFRTISAYDSDPRTLYDGTLVSEKNWSSDVPRLMMTGGTVERPLSSPSNDAYWLALLAADSRYPDDLRYDKVPDSDGGYNSNSFAHGILDATGGTCGSACSYKHVGWAFPVPASYF